VSGFPWSPAATGGDGYGRRIAADLTISSSVLTARVRIARLVVSWLLVGVGVPLLLRAELGVSPFDVLNTGVSHVTGWSLGTSFIVDSILLFVTGRLLGGRLGPACVPGTVVIGLMVNVGLDAIAVQHALVPRIAMLVAGLVIIAVAISLVVTTELGPGPTEVLMLGLVHRGMGIVPARWISDGLPVVLGAALGGSIGVGTVLFVVTMGPMVKAGLRVLRYQPSTRTTLDLPIVGP
jgi:uncharacterized membrane protein YczE